MFLGGADSEFVTTREILDEVSHIKRSQGAIETLIASGTLRVEQPNASSLNDITDAAGKTGDKAKLSAADMSILSLALQSNCPLVSDDYAVANVAKVLGIAVVHSLGKASSELRRWTNYCSGCGKAFSAETKICPLCGNALRRKYKKIK